MNAQYGAALLLLIASPFVVSAQENNDEPIDEIVVSGQSITASKMEASVERDMIVDTAAALRDLPGADVNRNGLLTGIAQYRGMFGDRVAVTIDNHAIISGGPNSMDSPLSYVSPMITEALVVERGIASVSSAPESIGGHLKTNLARGSFGGEDFGVSGFVGSRYSENGDLSTSAGRFTVADAAHRFSVITEFDNGNDVSTPAGDILPSALDRKRYDVSYAYTNGDSHVVVFAGKLDTTDAGTPALPMDIRLIDTNLAGGHFLYAVSPGISVEGRVSVNDVAHVMDNFGLRVAPPPMMHRQSDTASTGNTFALASKFDFESSTLRVGINQILADHEATITNPNNAAFQVNNFSDVERDLISLFGEWTLERDASAIEFGISVKRVDASAGQVGLSGMASPAIDTLINTFNTTDRNLTFDDVDAVIKYRYRVHDGLEWQFEVARKSRAPSYQELFLWLPLQATGGLADGRNYVGSLDLDSEHSNELNVGVVTSVGQMTISPQVFFKKIDGYIQGTPSSNAAANMVSMMMSGNPALEFTNVDAEIWGLDVAWSLPLSDRLSLDGIASYARGKRTDVSDNLYRLAPLNGNVGLTYARERWSFDARVLAYASQNKVSAYNAEQRTDHYEIANLGFTWKAMESTLFEIKVENLFDVSYEEHLTGLNRAVNPNIAIGDRLGGLSRTFIAGVRIEF